MRIAVTGICACDVPMVYVATVGEGARRSVLKVLQSLRRAGLAAVSDLQGRSLKAQMKEACRLGSRWVVLIGEDEMASGTITVRDMETQEQWRVPRSNLEASCGSRW